MKKILFILLLIPFLSNSQVGFMGVKIDADAASYIARVEGAGVTVTGHQRGTVNFYVIRTKQKILWTGLYDEALFIGGTAASHAETLKGVNDVTWNGTVTHDANGALSDGTTGYGALGFNANILTLNNAYIAIYSQTNNTQSSTDMGATNTTTQRLFFILYSTGSTLTDHNSSTSGTGRVIVANANTSGFYISTRISSTNLRIIKNGSQIGSTATSTNNGTLPAVEFVILAGNVNGTVGSWSTRKMSYWGAGTGLSATDGVIKSTLVNGLQRSLARNVY